MAYRDDYDFRLTIDGTTYPFMLATDDTGKRLWNAGLAPMLTTQQRIDRFSYEHIPPEIDVPLAFEMWNEGAGYSTALTSGSILRYNYSRGIDASCPSGHLHAAPSVHTTVESDDTAIAAAPTRIYQSSLGVYILAGAYIYQYDTVTGKLYQRDDASATGVSYVDIIEMDGILYASRGATTAYKYSSDGTTWTTSTAADPYAEYFTVRQSTTDIANLWKIVKQQITNTPDPINGGTAWSGSDEVGHSSETTTGAVTVGNLIFVFKREGFYSYDGTNSRTVWTTPYRDSTNGKHPYVWVDGCIYAPYGRRLLRYDPYGDTSLTAVFPLDAHDSTELKGQIVDITGDEDWLYLLVTNRAGNTYIIKGRPGEGWHTLAYLSTTASTCMTVIGPTAVHSTNPVLSLGYGTAFAYYILPRHNLCPADDPAYTFNTAGGTMYGPYVDFGAAAFNKFLNRGTVLGKNMSAGRSLALGYEIDDSGSTVAITTAVDNGLTEGTISSSVEFNRIRYYLTLASPDAAVSPVIDGITLHATLNPPRRRQWAPVVALSDELRTFEGRSTEYLPSADELEEILLAAATKRLTLTTMVGNTHTVRLLDATNAGVVRKQMGGKTYTARGLQLRLVEIEALSSNQSVAIYGESAYGDGRVYA
mgnify:FL=1